MLKLIAATAALLALSLFPKTADAQALCARKTVQFQGLASELTKQISNCYQYPEVCRRGPGPGPAPFGQMEKKTIAAWAPIGLWIATTTNPATPSSVTQQNSLMATTRNLATANKPAGKVVYGIQYFMDSLPGCFSCFLGAEVSYVKCL